MGLLGSRSIRAIDPWCVEAAGGIRTGSMLDILAMFLNQGRTEAMEDLSHRGDEFRSHEILDRLLLFGFREDVNVKLQDS